MNLSSNSELIFKKRYAIHEEETWQELSERVGRGGAQIEPDFKQWTDTFASDIYDMRFLPGGRILRNVGRPRGTLFNCYVEPLEDSMKQIGQFQMNCGILWSEGGGVGCNASFLRPEDAPIIQKGGESSGPISFLKWANAGANCIKTGGSRRAAALAMMNVQHPDIIKFINAKLVEGELNCFNISVAVTEDFLQAVEADDEWELSWRNKVWNKVRARDIWDLILKNMVSCAEPGLINWDNLRSNNSYYFDPIISTNPCVTGDTLIAVADGRNYVPIKQLAEEEKDVPVYSYNEKTKKPEVKIMRNPRITGVNKKIFKITLDDGSFFRCTKDHKIYLKNKSIKKACDLQIGDRLDHMVKYNASFDEIFKKSNSKSQDYLWINYGQTKTISEHKLIAEYKIGRNLGTGEVVHHKDRNGLNNNPNNLEVMSKKEHYDLHGLLMKGKNNPMNKYPEKNWLIKQDWGGSKNGRYKGYTPEQIEDIAIQYSKFMERRVTKQEWNNFCKENNIPYSKHSIQPYKSYNVFLKEMAKKANVYIYESSAELRAYNKFLEIKKDSDLDVFFNFNPNGIFVKKNCEYCNNEFIVLWKRRETCFCSRECSNKKKENNYDSFKERQLETRENQIGVYNNLKFQFKRPPLKKEWENECRENNIPFRLHSGNEHSFKNYSELKEEENDRNYKVISIEVDGYENVYNGTVDDNHNFYMMVNETKTKSGKNKYNHILTRQCGEVPLGAHGVCCLGSLVLPNFITGTKNTNWQLMEKTVHNSVRFLDNIIQVNRYVIDDVKRKAFDGRRIGLGVMGLAEYLFAKGVRYGSKDATKAIATLMENIRNYAYQASCKLAEEKEPFPKYDVKEYSKAHFFKTLPASIRMDIKKHGMRNVSVMAVAPTGTISLLPEVSSSVEPLFCKSYLRHDEIGDRAYIHPIYKDILEKKEETPEWYVDSFDLKPVDHFETQVAVQKYLDGAVSKTINCPKGFQADQLSDLLLEYIRDLKGVTLYVDGSREGQILNPLSREETLGYLKEGMIIQNQEEQSCATGTCEI